MIRPAVDDQVNLLAQHHAPGPAGNADTAGLINEELHEIPDDTEEVALCIEDHERTAAGDVFESDPAVGVCAGRNHLPRGTADLHSPGIFGANHLEHLTQGDAPLDLVDPRRGAIAGDAEQPGAFGFGRTHRRKPVGALLHDPGRRGKCLDVVDDSRLAQESVLDGERWLQPRRSPLALTRLDESGFITADVCAGARLDADVEPVAQQPFIAKLGQLLFEILPEIRILGAQVDDALRGPDGVGRDDHAHEHLLG